MITLREKDPRYKTSLQKDDVNQIIGMKPLNAAVHFGTRNTSVDVSLNANPSASRGQTLEQVYDLRPAKLLQGAANDQEHSPASREGVKRIPV